MKLRLIALTIGLAACASEKPEEHGGDLDAAVDTADGGGLEPSKCDIPAAGECDGQTLRRCENGELVSQDCTATQESCVLIDATTGFGCVDECEARDVDQAGRCDGNAAVRCDTVGGRHVVTTDPCGAGETCTAAAGQPAACVASACAGIGPVGRCDGDTLVGCSGSEPTTTNCASNGQVCAYVSNAVGYGCVAPTAAGAFVVSGTARYEDKPPLTSGGLGSITTVAVRSAQIAVVADSGSQVLATAVTGDDGSYTLRYNATAGTMVHVMVTARSPLTSRPVRVQRAANQDHAFGGASFAAAASATQHLVVPDSSGVSPAFNILDQGVHAMDAVRSKMDVAAPTALTARWSRGSSNGTYYSNNTIYLLGASSDDDGYDDTVILHEIGHFVEDTVGRSDSPGGGHDGSPVNPTLAWSEGFATYFSMAVRGIPLYLDSNAGGGWSYNADTEVTRAQASGSIGQNVSEDMISQCLWDIGDGGANDDDPMTSGSHNAVLKIEPSYLASASLRAVGAAGVDLVDFLDGWFLRTGLGSCSGVRGVVSTAHSFPYDYAGPGGRCP